MTAAVVPVRVGGVVERCRVERDGPFWRVTAVSRPDVVVTASTQAEAIKQMGRRLTALER